MAEVECVMNFDPYSIFVRLVGDSGTPGGRAGVGMCLEGSPIGTLSTLATVLSYEGGLGWFGSI